MMKNWMGIWIIICFLGCNAERKSPAKNSQTAYEVYVQVLGIAQDAGYPQVNCKKSCCADLLANNETGAYVSSIGLGKSSSKDYYIFDASPDFKYQLANMQKSMNTAELPSGIFLTHAHMGHYTGLMHLGREAMGAQSIPVFGMPKMNAFLSDNGPWSQLVDFKNIALEELQDSVTISLKDDLIVVPLQVPHRDEFSETVGYLINGPQKSLLFIPDIDKWDKWDLNILDLIREVDFALLDGTFYRNGEIFGRDMSEIPHPFIEESVELFNQLEETDRSKIFFIHLNHTNPLLNEASEEYQAFQYSGYQIAKEGQIFAL